MPVRGLVFCLRVCVFAVCFAALHSRSVGETSARTTSHFPHKLRRAIPTVMEHASAGIAVLMTGCGRVMGRAGQACRGGASRKYDQGTHT